MSGLIWAGIGKGIADAGQGFAQAGMKQLEMDRQDERDALREERLLKRQEALDELKATRARTTEEELQQRVIKESGKVQTRATEIGSERAGKAFDPLAESSAMAGEQGDVPLSKEQLQKLVKDNPALGEQYKKMGLIESSMPLTENQSRVRRVDDEVQASMEIGAHSSVIKGLQEKRKSVLEEIREENKEAKTKAETEQANRRLDLMEERITSQNKTDTIRANKPAGGSGGGGSGGIKVRSTYTNTEGNKVAVMSDGSEKTLGKAGDFDKSVASLVNTMSKSDYQFGKLPESEKRAKAIERLTGGTPAPKSGDNAGTPPATVSALPKGATQIGTSGGKPVYQTPDGKKFIGN